VSGRFDAYGRVRIVALSLTADTDRFTASLPKGYRARPFEDSDREPLVRVVRRARDGAGTEQFIRDLYDAEAPMWEDSAALGLTPHKP
jgi:hypothetical protein